MPQMSPSSPYVYSPTIPWSPRHATSSHEQRVPSRGPRMAKTDPFRYSPEQVAQFIELNTPSETSPILKKLILEHQIDGRTLVQCEEDYLSSLTGNDPRLTRDLLDVAEKFRKRSPSARLESPRSPRRLTLIVKDLINFDPPSQDTSPTNSYTPPETALLTPLAADPSIPEWDFGTTDSRSGEASTSHDGLINLGTAAETEGDNHVSLLFNPPSSAPAPALLSALQVPRILPHSYMSPYLGGSLDAMVLQLQDGMAAVGSGDRPAGQDDLPARQDRQAMPSDTDPAVDLLDPPDQIGQIANVGAVEMAIQTDIAEEPASAPAPVPQRTFVDASTQTEVAEREEATFFVVSRPQTDPNPSEEPPDAPVTPHGLEPEPEPTGSDIENASAPAAAVNPLTTPEDVPQDSGFVDTAASDDAGADLVDSQLHITLPEVDGGHSAECSSFQGESEGEKRTQNEGTLVELEPNTVAEASSGVDGEARTAKSLESPEEPTAHEDGRSEPAVTVEAPSTQSAESTFGSQDGHEGDRAGAEEQEPAAAELAESGLVTAEHTQEASGDVAGATDGPVNTSEQTPTSANTAAPVDKVVELGEPQSSTAQPDAEQGQSEEDMTVRGENETEGHMQEDGARLEHPLLADVDVPHSTDDEEHTVERFATAEEHLPQEDGHPKLVDTVGQPSSESAQDALDSTDSKDDPADASQEQLSVSSESALTDEIVAEPTQEAAKGATESSDDLMSFSDANEPTSSQLGRPVETRDEQSEGEATVIVRSAEADEHMTGLRDGEGAPQLTFANLSLTPEAPVVPTSETQVNEDTTSADRDPPTGHVDVQEDGDSQLRFEAVVQRPVYVVPPSPDVLRSVVVLPTETQVTGNTELANHEPPASHAEVQGNTDSQLQFEALTRRPMFRVRPSPDVLRSVVLPSSKAQIAGYTGRAGHEPLAGDAENVRESWATAENVRESWATALEMNDLVTQTEGDGLRSPADNLEEMYAEPEQVAGASSETHEGSEQNAVEQHTGDQHDSEGSTGEMIVPMADTGNAAQSTQAAQQHAAEPKIASSASPENPPVSAEGSGEEEATNAHHREETDQTIIGEAADHAGAGGLGGDYDMVDKDSALPTSHSFREDGQGGLGGEVKETPETTGGEQGTVPDQVEDVTTEDGEWTLTGSSSGRRGPMKTLIDKGKGLIRTVLERAHSASDVNSTLASPVQDSELESPAVENTTTEDGGDEDEGGDGDGDGDGDGGDEDKDDNGGASTSNKKNKKKKNKKNKKKKKGG